MSVSDAEPLAKLVSITPPKYAQRLGVSSSKVLAWIRSGELLAINVAQNTIGRPRWRISPSAIASFEASRAAKPPTKSTRRRKRDATVIEYF